MRPACICLDAMPEPLDPSRCPLCGQPNTCGQADAATAGQPCWCFAAKVAPQSLAQLPEALKNQACLCPRCVQGLPPQREA